MIQFFTSHRAKSFYWRTGMMVLALYINFLLTGASSGEITLPAWATVLLGLVLGEISKFLNSPASE